MARFWASSGNGRANRARSRTVGVAALTAGMPTLEALPSDCNEGTDSLENGTRSTKKRWRLEAAALRLTSTGS